MLTLVANALERAGQGGGRITMDAVLPINDPEDGMEVPTYQIYVVVAWLRAEELIVQHGRQGYTVPVTGSLDKLAGEHFAKLPQR